MKKSKKLFDKAQARNKKNYDERLRKKPEGFPEDDYVYFSVEPMSPKNHKQKFTQIIEGPSKMMNADTHAVIIEKSEQSIEMVSRSRVVLAPNSCPEKKTKTGH